MPDGTFETIGALSPVVLAHEPGFRIGSAEFRPSTREIICEGRPSVIEPRVMQFLVALHRADGGVVSKEDLGELCWEGRVVGEDAINRVVSRARAVAGKQAGGQFRIETITKVGYRLVAADGEDPSNPEPRVVQPQNARGFGRRELLVGGAVAATATASGAAWYLFAADRTPAEAKLLIEDARSSLYQTLSDQNANAIGKLRQAVTLAPQSADAWGLLGLAYACASLVARADQRQNLRARADAAQRQAFAIEPGQPDALAAELSLTPQYRNWYKYEKSCRAALDRHPDHPVLQGKLGLLLCNVGRYGEALPFYEASLRSVPLCAHSMFARIIILWDLGRFDEADAAVEQAFGLLPGQFGIWFTKFYYLMFNGRAKEAIGMVEDTTGRPMGIPDWNFDLLAVGAKAIDNGDGSALHEAVQAWSEAAHKGTGFAENAAMFAAFAGDPDTSFRILDALYFNRGFKMPDLYFTSEQRIWTVGERHTYNLFRRPIVPIHHDPRFADLTRELGLDDYWTRTGTKPTAPS